MQLTVDASVYTLQVTGGNQLQLRLDLSSQPIYSLRVSEVVQLQITQADGVLIDEPGYRDLLAHIADDLGFGLVPDRVITLASPIRTGTARRPDRLLLYYLVVEAPHQTLLPHGADSLLVEGFCYPLNVQDMQNLSTLPDEMLSQDRLWSAKAVDMNNARLVGPVTETFSGIVILAIFPMPLNPIIINPNNVPL
jgi:hypothetical protein